MTAPFQSGERGGAPTQDRRRSPLGRPSAFVALLLLAAAAYCVWLALSSPPSRCGMTTAIGILGAALLVAAAMGVICLDMLIRLMDS